MDAVRLPAFEIDGGEGARTHGRGSTQSDRVAFITWVDQRRVAAERRHPRRFDLIGLGWTVLSVDSRRSGRCRQADIAVGTPIPRQQAVLIDHGLRTPEFLITDGGVRLERALAALWPDLPAQRHTVHKRGWGTNTSRLRQELR